jgi:hypothetical protein
MQYMQQGLVYIAFGDRYRHEAQQSIASVRRQSPDIPVAVITDAEWDNCDRPDMFILEATDATLGAKPRLLYRCTPFERSLFIDTDTVLARDITPAFTLLDYYDFCVKFSGGELTIDPALIYHPMASSGMMIFKKCNAVAGLFELWLEAYRAAERSITPRRPNGPQDDKYLASAIARSGVRVIHLPEYLMFNLWEPTISFSAPVVIHGRHKNLANIGRWLSGQWTRSGNRPWQRVWLPNLLGLLPNGLRRSDPLLIASFIIRRVISEIRYARSRWGDDESGKG